MKKKLLLVSIFIGLISMKGYSQQNNKKISLEWNKVEKISLVRNQTVSTLLLKNKLFDESFLPIYSKSWKTSKNNIVKSYRLTNITYKTISKNNYPKESWDKFPSEVTSNLDIKSAKDMTYLTLHITPIVFKNGLLKQILSFELDYELAPKKFRKDFSSVHDSPLSTGTWFKFSVDTTGVYKLDRSFLNSIGLSTSSINPKNIQIYGNGGAMLNEINGDFRYDGLQENAIFISGEDDNSFDANDFILFYAQGSDIWVPNLNTNRAQHQNNIYSDKAYYFIRVGDDPGLRISNQIVNNNPSNINVSTFNDYMLHEVDIRSIDKLGQDFFGEDFSIEDTQTFTFNFTDIDTSQDLNVRFKAAVTDTSNFTIDVNGQNTSNLNIAVSSVSYIVGGSGESISSTSVSSEQIQVNVSYNNGGIPSKSGYLDFIELNGIKHLIARDKQFSFRSFNVANNTLNTDVIEYQIQNTNTIFQIWNVTDKLHPKTITNQSNDTDFKFNTFGGELQEFVILNETDFYTPERLSDSRVVNQNLHGLQDIDYLIITEESLVNEAQRLADYHQANSGLSTLVLTQDIIFNEFSSGAKDATAIRDFIKHLYSNASIPSKRIKYVCMFGDTSFDYKNIEGNNFATNNPTGINVISVQSKNSFNLATSYVTDDFFGMMDDNEGDFTVGKGSGDLQDVAIGRMPVKSIEEARVSIDKTLTYYDVESFGDWRNHISLVADDLDNGTSDYSLELNIELIADLIKNNKPNYNLTKIFSDAFVQEISAGGERYPQVSDAINNAVERGSLIINYFGHGGENGWAAERILDVPQIQNWFNNKTLPLFITITCEFSKYDKPSRTTAGEFVFSNPNGGSINMITTSREVFISFGALFNIDLIEDLLEFNNTNNDYTISESLIKSKNKNQFQVQRLFIQFFGDPAMKLPRPKPNIIITHMNDVEITQQLDTIRALSHVYFKGIVTDNNNNILPNFNGELSASVFDKSVDRTTLNNDNNFLANGNPATMVFDSRESKIFNGKATVENGLWAFDFIAPRDIRIAFGNAKISLYAENQIVDKGGYNTDIIIGGINENAPIDTTGPQIRLFMNDESFIDGGNTNESPLFLAFLEDESGINTSLTAVDHDIIGILDGDQNNPIIMNDYYETELNDFTKGKVKFPFRNLSVGLHTITFKCWDTYNNPSEATLNFVVVSDSDLVLDHVLNYPNPFISYTEFWFNHNKPNEPLEAQIQIFTVSGKLIRTLNQNVTTNGTLSRSITWNGLDDFGNKIGKGVYVYKLNVKVISSGLKTEKIEKLVILQ
jgi:hypothetical protein